MKDIKKGNRPLTFDLPLSFPICTPLDWTPLEIT